MDVAAIEQALIDRLSPLRQAGLLVRALPNQSGETGKIEGNGAITLSWALDEATAPSSMGFFTQDCLMSWVLDIRLRNLREEAGAWEIRKAIYGLLVGFQPPGCKKMYARRFEFVDRTDAVWVFQATFIVPTVLMEVGQPDEELPLLKDIFLADETVNGVEVAETYPLIDT
ncbi:Gp37 family protein [Leptolyngbya ohadii]|uniref:Gp37 family protein n=1 Tax=Leptolyngbya ohadii TaxID=1962290 RepID=UPI000B598FE5|nr:Gp37 family protein [Leptolyngbya ohadii]